MTTNANTLKISPSGDEIDLTAIYSLTTQNGVTRTVLGSCLFYSYLANRLDADLVKSYSRVPGAWYDVFFKGKKVFCVYALNETSALTKRKDYLDNLGYTDPKHLSASLADDQVAA